MLYVGQEVMVIGDNRCPIGMVSQIVEVLPCDFGDQGIVNTYRLASYPTIGFSEVYFQEQHLMPLDEFETTVGGLMELDLNTPVDVVLV